MSLKSEETATSADETQSLKMDYDAMIRVQYVDGEQQKEGTVYAHRLVLISFSPMFAKMLDEMSSDEMATLELDLTQFSNGFEAFKIIIGTLYSGEVKLNGLTVVEILAVCRHCQFTSIESKIMAAAPSVNFNVSSIFNTKNVDYGNTNPFQAYVNTMFQLWTNPLFSALCNNPNNQFAISPTSEDSTSRTQSEGSSPRANSVATPPTSDLEKIVPNDDKEGWCRNKKYIEKVEGGFMCTVCRKIYGRYNSVSYHVTIYHRNPPIRCEENGCNFSTREARYIHFHKYYRHHIALPENIDLGSRKCPFCRHVSKSPAMLEKHIARHESDNNGSGSGTSGNVKKITNGKKKTTPLLPDLLNTMAMQNVPLLPSGTINPTTPSTSIPSNPMKCTLCPFSTYTTDVLFIHLATIHAKELTQPKQSDEPLTQIPETNNSLQFDIKPLLSQLQLTPLQLDTSI